MTRFYASEVSQTGRDQTVRWMPESLRHHGQDWNVTTRCGNMWKRGHRELPGVLLFADQLWNVHRRSPPSTLRPVKKLETEMCTGESGASLIGKIEAYDTGS